jgi:hypothetical protein
MTVILVEDLAPKPPPTTGPVVKLRVLPKEKLSDACALGAFIRAACWSGRVRRDS